MCDDHNAVNVQVRMLGAPHDEFKIKPIDRCIAPIVSALVEGGVDTAASCCGHGKGPGNILLHDGRALLVFDDHDTALGIADGWALSETYETEERSKFPAAANPGTEKQQLTAYESWALEHLRRAKEHQLAANPNPEER